MAKGLGGKSCRRAAGRGRAVAISLALLAGGGAAVAEDPSAIELRGFGTVGATRTSSSQVSFVRDLSQPDGAVNRWTGNVDSLLGAQVNIPLAPQLEGVVQAVSRYRYDKSYDPEVSWAYLAYQPDAATRLRLGRLGAEFFMLSDSRLVGYSYLTVRPPGDFFWSLPFQHIDGADASLSLPVGESLLVGKVFYGQVNEHLPLADMVWKTAGSTMGGVLADIHHGPLLLRAAYSAIHFRRDLPIEKAIRALLPGGLATSSLDYLAVAGTRSDYLSLGAVYDQGPWQVQLMFNHIRHGTKAFQNSDAGYLLAGYRLGQITPFVGYSWVSSKMGGPTPNAVTTAVRADSHAHQKTGFVGARWDLANNMALKAQWDALHGAPDSIFPFRREKPEWKGRLDIFSMTMDFVF